MSMDVTWLTWTVAVVGLALISLLCALELVAVVQSDFGLDSAIRNARLK